MEQSRATDREPIEAEKRANVIRLVFDNDSMKLDAFVQLIKRSIPRRPGTSDLDLTLRRRIRCITIVR